MTKEEARQSLFNTKVYVDGKNKEIQEKLFEIGFKWTDNRTCVCFLNKPFLFFDDCGLISHSCDMGCFTDSEYKEISAAYILNLKWDEEYPNFYPSVSDRMIAELKKRLKDNYTIKSKLEVGVDLSENRDYSVINVFIPGNRSGTKYYNATKKAINELDNKPKETSDFNPFDKVLGRDTNDEEWTPDFFQKYIPEDNAKHPYYCIGDCYSQCIPYEGNEDKLK